MRTEALSVVELLVKRIGGKNDVLLLEQIVMYNVCECNVTFLTFN